MNSVRAIRFGPNGTLQRIGARSSRKRSIRGRENRPNPFNYLGEEGLDNVDDDTGFSRKKTTYGGGKKKGDDCNKEHRRGGQSDLGSRKRTGFGGKGRTRMIEEKISPLKDRRGWS